MGQREIKFRGWDGIQMRSWDDLRSDGHSFFDIVEHDLSPYTVMQFTGLKDKNGVEIYEGDVFDCIYKLDGCVWHKVIIKWSDNLAGFHAYRTGNCQQRGVTFHAHEFRREQIIGNIYENPELIEKAEAT